MERPSGESRVTATHSLQCPDNQVLLCGEILKTHTLSHICTWAIPDAFWNSLVLLMVCAALGLCIRHLLVPIMVDFIITESLFKV